MARICKFNEPQFEILHSGVCRLMGRVVKEQEAFTVTGFVKRMYDYAHKGAKNQGKTDDAATLQALTYARMVPKSLVRLIAEVPEVSMYLRKEMSETHPSIDKFNIEELYNLMDDFMMEDTGLNAVKDLLGMRRDMRKVLRTANQEEKFTEEPVKKITKKETMKKQPRFNRKITKPSGKAAINFLVGIFDAKPYTPLADKDYELTKDRQFDEMQAPYYILKRALVRSLENGTGESDTAELEGIGKVYFSIRPSTEIPEEHRRIDTFDNQSTGDETYADSRSLAMVLVDETGKEVYVDENGKPTLEESEGALAYWKMPKITEENFDEDGKWKETKQHTKKEFINMRNSLIDQFGITEVAAHKTIEEEFRLLKDIRDHIDQTGEPLVAKINGGSLGNIHYDIMHEEPLSNLNIEDENIRLRHIDIRNEEGGEREGQTYFKTKTTGDANIVINKPAMKSVPGMVDKVISLLLDPLFVRDPGSGKLRPITDEERQFYFEQYYFTRKGILQVPREDKIDYIILHGKVLDINDETRESVRKELKEFFNADYTAARIKDTSLSGVQLTRRQKEKEVENPEDVEIYGVTKIPGSETRYYVYEPVPLNIRKIDFGETFTDVEIVEEDGKMVLKETETKQWDFLAAHFSIPYKLSPNGKIERINAWMAFKLDNESLNKVRPGSVEAPETEAPPVKDSSLDTPGPADTKDDKSIDEEYGMDDSMFEDKRKLQKQRNKPVSKEEEAAAEKWFKSSPLADHISYHKMFGIVNTRRPNSIATWSLQGAVLNEATSSRIDLYKGSDLTDLYHEAFHGFFQTFLTMEQKAAIIAEVRKMTGTFVDHNGSTVSFRNASPKQIEEWLAEDFRTYMIEGGKAVKQTKKKMGFFTWLKNFIKAIWEGISVSDVTTNESSVKVLHDVYEKLRVGNLHEYSFDAANATAAIMDKGGIQSISENRVRKNLNYEDSKMIIDSIDSIISEFIDLFNSGQVGKISRQQISRIQYKRFKGIPLTDDEIDITEMLKVRETYKFTKLILKNKKTLSKAYKYVLDRFHDMYELFSEEQEKYLEDPDKNMTKIETLQYTLDVISWAINEFGNVTDLENNLKGNLKNRGVINYHQKKSMLISKEESLAFFENKLADELDISEEDASLIDARDEDHKNPGNTQSLEEMAAEEVLYLIRSLHETEKGKEFNRMGVRNLVTFEKAWNRLGRTLQNSLEPEDMLVRLEKEQGSYGPIEQLLAKLGPVKTGDNENVHLWTNFWQSFNKTHIPLNMVTIEGITYDEDGNQLERPVYSINIGKAHLESKKVGRRWESDFKMVKPGKSKYIKRNNLNQNYLDVEQVLKDFSYNSVVEDPFDFFNAIGFKLDDVDEIREAIKGKDGVGGARYIWSALRYVNERGETIYEFGDFLRSYPEGKTKDGKEQGSKRHEYPAYNQLQELQARYSDDYSNFSVTTAKGNTQFEHSLNSTMTVMINTINQAKSYKALIALPHMSHLDIRRSPMLRSSQWLNSMFKIRDAAGNMLRWDDPEFGKRRYNDAWQPIQLILNNQSGILLKKDGRQVGEGVDSASADEFTKFIMDYHYTLIESHPELMRHADKSTSYSVRVSDLYRKRLLGPDNKLMGKSRSELYVDTYDFIELKEGIETGIEGDVFILGEDEPRVTKGEDQGAAIVMRHIASELDRIKMLKDLEKQNIENYDFEYIKRGQKFALFERVISKEVQEKLLTKEVMDMGLENYLKLSHEKGPKAEKAAKLRNELYKDIVLYFREQLDEAQKLMDGAVEGGFISRKLETEFQGTAARTRRKSDKESIRRGMMLSFVYNNWLHNVESLAMFYGDIALYKYQKEEFHKRNAGIGSTGNLFRTDEAMLDYINNMQDDKGRSMGRYYQTLNTNYDSRAYDGTFNTAVLEDVRLKSVYYKEISKALEGIDSLKHYDGTQKGSLMEEVANAQGYITFDSYRILRTAEGIWTDVQEKIYKKISRGEEVDLNEIVEAFPIMKLQYWGPLKTEHLPLIGFHKYSMMPLIPTVIKDSPKLQELHNKMMSEGIDYLTFKSGSKVSNVTKTADSHDRFYENNETKELSKEPFTKNIIFVNYLKDQLKIHSKFKEEIRFSTQLRKLIEDGLMEFGVPTDYMTDKEDYERMTSWRELSEKERLDISDNYRLVRRYENNIAELTKRKTEKLLKDAGWIRDKDGKLVGDQTKLVDFIKAQLDNQDISEHELDFIEVDDDGQLKNDLSLSLSADKIERMLNAIVVNRLVKQKVRGENLVLAAGLGFENLIDEFAGKESAKPIYSAVFVDETKLTTKYKPVHKNVYSHHSTIQFRPDDIMDLPVGEAAELEITGRLTTDKVDVLLVKNPLSKNKFAHITLSTAEGVKPFESNKEIEENQDKIKPLKGKIEGTVGFLDAEKGEVTGLGKFRKPTQEEIEKYQGTLGLPFYTRGADGRTNAMKVAIALQGDFVHLLRLEHNDGEVIGTIDRLNEMIKDDEWLDKGDHRKMITMVGVRIPVQGLNSMEFMEVYHFLDPSAGNLIIPPAEMVAKSGSDYDIDKLTVMMPNITMVGNSPELVKTRYDVKETEKELSDEIKALRKERREGIWKDAIAEEYKEIRDTDFFKERTQQEKDFLTKMYTEYINNVIKLESQISELPDAWNDDIKRDIVSIQNQIKVEEQNWMKHSKMYKDAYKKERQKEWWDKKTKAQLDKINKKIADIQRKINGLSTKGLENDLITDIAEILSLPENYEKLIRPNDTDIVRPLSEFLSKYVRDRDYRKEDGTIAGTRVLEIGYNLYKHSSNAIGKQVLGIGAVDNTYNILFNRVGAYLNPDNGNQNKKHFRRQELFLPHKSFTIDGKKVISLSHGYDTVDGNYIGDVINQLINGWVDIAKDAWIFDIQGNKEISPTLLFLIQAGVPFKTAVYFMSQPIIREYVKKQKAVKSTFATPFGLAPSSPRNFRHKAKVEMLLDPDYGFTIPPVQLKDGSLTIRNKDVYDETVKRLNSKLNANAFTEERLEKQIISHHNQIKEGKKPTYGKFQQLVLLHFFEMEEMGKAVRDIKMNMNVDTKKSATLFDAMNKQHKIESLKRDGRFPPHIIEQLLGARDEENALTNPTSPISSFFVQPLQQRIWGKLFPIRNHPITNLFLTKMFAPGGRGPDHVDETFPGKSERFTNEFRNSVISWIFQNSLMPVDLDKMKFYRGLNVKDGAKIKKMTTLKIGAFVKGDEMFISRKDLRDQWVLMGNNQTTKQINDYYKKLGLAPFEPLRKPIRTEDEYYRFVLEREVLRDIWKDQKDSEEYISYENFQINNMKRKKDETKEAFQKRVKPLMFEMFIRDKALDNILNHWKLFNSNYTYADQFQQLINDYENLLDDFMLVDQLAIQSIETNGKVYTNLKLADSRVKADNINIMYENLQTLANRTAVQKGYTEKEWKRISDFFKRFPLVAFLQSGINTKGIFALSRIIPENDYLAIIKPASQQFIKNVNLGVMQKIFDQFMKENREYRRQERIRSQDYVDNSRLARDLFTEEKLKKDEEQKTVRPGYRQMRKNVQFLAPEVKKGFPVHLVEKIRTIFSGAEFNEISDEQYNKLVKSYQDQMEYDPWKTRVAEQFEALNITQDDYEWLMKKANRAGISYLMMDMFDQETLEKYDLGKEPYMFDDFLYMVMERQRALVYIDPNQLEFPFYEEAYGEEKAPTDIGPGLIYHAPGVAKFSYDVNKEMKIDGTTKGVTPEHRFEKMIADNPDVVFVYTKATREGSNKGGATIKDYPMSKIAERTGNENLIGLPIQHQYTGGSSQMAYNDKDSKEERELRKVELDNALALIKQKQAEGKTIAFLSEGYGQYMIAEEAITGRVKKETAPKYFNYLSKELFNNFGFINPGYIKRTEGRQVIQTSQGLTDEEVIERMKQCITL